MPCNSCTGEFIVIFTYVFTMYLRFAYSIVLPTLSYPLLRTISTGFFHLFSYINKKYIHYIHPHLPFPNALSLPLLPTQEKICFTLL
jgi:hypothetical protein